MELRDLVEGYHQQLLESPEGLSWHRSRGLTESTVLRRKLGWITVPLRPEHAVDKGSPVIPYISALGDPVELRRRSLTRTPKYLRLEHSFPLPIKQHLYGAVDAMPSPRRTLVVVAEGEYDAMIASQCGFRAIGVPGVTNWRDAWNHLLGDADVRIAFDGDDAGRGAAGDLLGRFAKARIRARVIQMPAGMDLTEVFLARGADGVKALVGR